MKREMKSVMCASLFCISLNKCAHFISYTYHTCSTVKDLQRMLHGKHVTPLVYTELMTTDFGVRY